MLDDLLETVAFPADLVGQWCCRFVLCTLREATSRGKHYPLSVSLARPTARSANETVCASEPYIAGVNRYVNPM